MIIVFYLDADMRIDEVVTSEEVCGDLVATRPWISIISPANVQSFDHNLNLLHVSLT